MLNAISACMYPGKASLCSWRWMKTTAVTQVVWTVGMIMQGASKHKNRRCPEESGFIHGKRQEKLPGSGLDRVNKKTGTGIDCNKRYYRTIR